MLYFSIWLEFLVDDGSLFYCYKLLADLSLSLYGDNITAALTDFFLEDYSLYCGSSSNYIDGEAYWCIAFLFDLTLIELFRFLFSLVFGGLRLSFC